jgi:2-dehydropantoate 2-reductase
MMKIAIVGAGSIGSVIAAYLDRAGHQVSVLARGAHLAAIREHGLTVASRGERLTSHPAASADPSELGPQDMVIVTVKAHSLAAVAPGLASLRRHETPVIAAQNGLPWWYFHGQQLAGPAAALSGRSFEAVDPGGIAWRLIGPEQAIGCVINIPAEVIAPGVVTHGGRLSLTLGAPNPKAPPSGLTAAAETLAAAGIETIVTDRIRHAVWEKLQLNISTGPCTALTGATVGELHQGPGIVPLLAALMQESRAVAAAQGIDLPDDIAERLARSGGAVAHKTSMLQDFEAGRPLELDAIVTAVVDLARLAGVPVPTIEAVLALIRLRTACRDAG